MQFNLQAHLDSLTQLLNQKFTLPNTLTEWQSEFHDALLEVLGIDGRVPFITPKTTLLSSNDKGKYIEEKYFFVLDDVAVPMYLLIPKSDPPYKTLLAFHGHGIGVNQILGHYADENIRQKMITNDENFAQRFAEDGYLVCAIEQRGFGERITEQVNESGNSCRHLSFEYMMHKRTLLGERIRDGIATINYVLSRDDISMNTLSCVGHSGGATTALFLSALDNRLTHNIISGYFCDYRYSILAMPHCECNYVPALSTLADISDITSLIAPRHLLLIHGENDPIFPIEGFHSAYTTIKHAYATSQKPDHLSIHTHNKGHQFNYACAIKWLT